MQWAEEIPLLEVRRRRGQGSGRVVQVTSRWWNQSARSGSLGGEAKASVGRLRQVERVALLEPQPGHCFLGQDDAGGRPDRGDLACDHAASPLVHIIDIIWKSGFPVTANRSRTVPRDPTTREVRKSGCRLGRVPDCRTASDEGLRRRCLL